MYLQLDGLLRGWGLPLFDIASTAAAAASGDADEEQQQQRRTGRPYMHLTGWGDFPLHAAEWTDYKPARKQHHAPPPVHKWVSSGQEADEMLPDDALTAAWDDMQLEDDSEIEEEEDSDEGMLVTFNTGTQIVESASRLVM